LPEPTPDLLERLERELAGSVGAATAHAMISQVAGGASVSVKDLIAVADETAQMMEYSSRLEAQSQELSRTAARLREANHKLTQLSVQKDSFLSKVSHELRTPMTSIRAFSEILMQSESLAPEERNRFSEIIHGESLRLTRLLDDLLDLSVLENGQVTLNVRDETLANVIDRAVAATEQPKDARALEVIRDRATEELDLFTDSDRLTQVFINLIANAQKYCEADRPVLTISVGHERGRDFVDFIDNGAGIPPATQAVLFEKFSRGTDARAAGGAGLGLAICREIMNRLGGSVRYLPVSAGTAFRVYLPARPAVAAQ
jgi:signal transduction histidine kinase